MKIRYAILFCTLLLVNVTAGESAVFLREDANSIVLSNAEVSLQFDRAKGALKSLRYHDKELLTSGGGYVQVAFTSRKDNPKIVWDYRLIRRTADLIEIAFVNTSKECAFDFAAHYILRTGESGFHNYLTWGHDAVRSPAILKLAQYNYALRIDPILFTTCVVDDQRIVPFPRGDLLTPDKAVMDATYKLPDGSYYSKYFFSAERDEKHRVHGATGSNLGIWMIMPSHEHLNGGPEHQELAVHQAGVSQILLAHAEGAHFGAGVLTSDSKEGSWSKTSAPWFIYVNTSTHPDELWQDAKKQAEVQAAEWPYAWLDDEKFQLHRGGVSGRLLFADHTPVNGARVILAVHEDKPGPLLWQQQWRGYRFSGWADKDGRFEIGKMRSGNYDLYAWQPGSFGHYLKCNVRVNTGETVSLGDMVWNKPTRTTLWQIGTPDHSAQEFGFGDTFRQWGLWQQIAEKYPDGVTYTIGTSTARDWPFEMAVAQKPDHSWHLPEWHVKFDNPSARIGKASLMLGVAAYEGKIKPQLSISLNGETIGSIDDLEISGAAHRSGVHAGYQEREITFDASKLKIGTNTLTVSMPAPGRNPEKMLATPGAALLWDVLRLELQGN